MTTRAHRSSTPTEPGRPMAVARLVWGMALTVVILNAASRVGGLDEMPSFIAGHQSSPLVFALCSIAVAFAAIGSRRKPARWALAAGLAGYTVGQGMVIQFGSTDYTFPEYTDALSWTLYPCVVLAVVFLVRERVASDRRWELWLDGVIAGSATCAVGLVLVAEIVEGAGGTWNGAPGNTVYILGDLLVLGFGAAGCALASWRPPRELIVLLFGFLLQLIDDVAFVISTVNETFTPAGLLDNYWILVFTIIAASAVWSPDHDGPVAADRGVRVVAVPIVFATAAVGVTALGSIVDGPDGAIALAAFALLAAVTRFALTFRAQEKLIDSTQSVAQTDELTGLGNRRKLMADATLMMSQPDEPVLFAILDLNRLKSYNDTHGHPAGDILLSRMGHRLGTAMRAVGASAYRIGGDEFCILITGKERTRDLALKLAVDALRDDSEQPMISASYGTATVPWEATDISSAMVVADRNLYEAKKLPRQ